MRVISFLVIMLAISMNGMAQTTGIIVERNNNGTISSVKYPREDKSEAVPENATMFFSNVLKVRNEDTFKLQHSSKAKYGMSFERYVQFYQGIEVDGGFYSFRYKNGRMLAACGNYVSTDNLKTVPSITEEEVSNIFANYMKDKISDIGNCHIKLVITEKPNSKDAVLAYKVFFETSSIHASEIGYIDAHTGNLIYTLPASICYSALGTFYTLYNNSSPKTARTEYVDGNTGYILYDTTRGYGIHTYNGTGNPSNEFCDADNIWTASELGSFQMALDVHWTLQQIYDVLNNEYGHNSFDGANAAINAYVISDCNAYFNSALNILLFGMGQNPYGPLASVDIIGHEFGHGILFNTTYLGSVGYDRDAIHEGFGDIWGLLFEHQITPNADIWKTGEDVMIGYSCERDFAYPKNPNAHTKIADTYNYGLYNTGDEHVRGGIAAHWFHLLVNGGSGTNEKNDTYTVYPVGLNSAEELFTYTVLNNSYLDNCSTFVQVRQAFVDAANDMNNPFLAMQVANAWYAVGVGQPSQICLLGPSTICTASTEAYTFDNIPSDYTFNWNIDNNDYSITPSGNQCFVEYTGFPLYNVANLTATISKQGQTITTLTKRIVMHGSDMYATGWQDGNLFTPNGTYPDREFTIPANNGLLFSRSKAERPNIDDIFGKDKESLPIVFIEDQTQDGELRNPIDVCGYGITEINGGNTVYLNSTRFDGMDISFSGTHSPTSYFHNEEYIAFEMPYHSIEYYTTLYATSPASCHDFCLKFKVVPLPGAASGDDDIWVNLDGSMLYITFMGASSGYSVTISKIPSGTQVYSNTFPGNQNSFSVNTSSWTSGIYSIRIVQGNNVYTKSIYL